MESKNTDKYLEWLGEQVKAGKMTEYRQSQLIIKWCRKNGFPI